MQALFSHLLVIQGGNSCLIYCQIYLNSEGPDPSSSLVDPPNKDAWLRWTVQVDSSSGMRQALVQTYCGELRGFRDDSSSSAELMPFQLWFLLQNHAGIFAGRFKSLVFMVWTPWPETVPCLRRGRTAHGNKTKTKIPCSRKGWKAMASVLSG